MAKRQEEEPAKGSPAWMSTFSDLMNLLLCFFILLFASSTVDSEKLQAVTASFSKPGIFAAASQKIGSGGMVSSGVNQISVLSKYVDSLGRNKKGTTTNYSSAKEDTKKTDTKKVEETDQSGSSSSKSKSDASEKIKKSVKSEIAKKTSVAKSATVKSTESKGQNGKTQNTSKTSDKSVSEALSSDNIEKQVKKSGYEQSEQMNEEIENMLKTASVSDKVSMTYNAQYVQLSLNGGILFESGKADLTPDAKVIVDKVGNILERYRNRTIEIEGHTDNVPSSGSGVFKDNQYLSSARAISVYEYLLKHNDLIPKNMKHSGYGDSRPKVSNKTEKGRAMNRRVEIKIYNKLSSED